MAEPSIPTNPFRQLLAMAMAIHEEEGARCGKLAGRREPLHEWGARSRNRELELQAIRDDCLRIAHQTECPVLTVEQRVNDMVQALTAIIYWQQRARCMTREELDAPTRNDPASIYLVEQANRMFAAWQPVNALGVLVDGALQAVDRNKGKRKGERGASVKGKRISEKILKALDKDSLESLGRTAQQWADQFGCVKSTVTESPAWQKIKQLRADAQAFRVSEQRRHARGN